jgi:UPF0042 nucleotide-binding protein
LADDPANDMPQLAAVIDVRGGSLFSDATDAIVALSHESNVEIVFLDSTNDVLVRRFEQVRRPHPLQEDGTLLDGIERERSLMQEIRERSDFVMDTSEMNIHQLSTAISKIYSEPEDARIRLTIISFGYKYGLPSDVDMVADMRFLPNPYWEESLRSLSGKDQAVSDYVTGNPLAKEFMDSYENSLAAVLRGYAGENKTFATLAIGCTGGKHRSVAMAENMANRLRGRDDIQVAVKHRDLGRE